MKKNPFLVLILCVSIILLASAELCGQEDSNIKIGVSEKINRPYIDLSLGGMLIPGQATAFNLHGSVGYQVNSFLGLGIGTTASTNYNDLSHRSFQGWGLEYKLNTKGTVFRYMLGVVKSFNYPYDSNEIYEYHSKKDLFHRISLGYSPTNGHINFGAVINATKGKFNKSSCIFNIQPDCIDLGIVPVWIVSPQLYFGINIFKSR